MRLVTLTFDLVTLKLVCESHQRWGTFIPNLSIGLWVLELFATYTRRTDGRTKPTLNAPFPTGEEVLNENKHVQDVQTCTSNYYVH